MKFIPLNDRVLIEPFEASAMTRGGLHLPEASKEVSTRGTVLAVGPGNMNINGDRIPTMVKVGDVVLYDARYDITIEIEGKNVLILQEGQLLGVCGE